MNMIPAFLRRHKATFPNNKWYIAVRKSHPTRVDLMGLSQLSGTTASKSISLQRPTMVVFFYDCAAEKLTCIPKWLAKGNTAGGMHFQVHASFQWGGFTLTVHQRVIHYEEPLIKINSHEQESTIHHHQNSINKHHRLLIQFDDATIQITSFARA